VTGRRQPPDYVTNTETQREYQNPNVKSIEHLKHIEENRHGRYAYSPNQNPPNGICQLYLIIFLSIFIVHIFSAYIQCESLS
jgi:hypothetical protein